MNKWIAHESNIDKDINIFCFPHSGGTAAYFAAWGNVLKNEAVMPVQFPMREKRIREKMEDTIQELAKDFVDGCIDVLREKKFCVLGHCSGSIVAYEATKYLKEQYNMSPEIMFVSSCYAPENYSAPKLSHLENEELLKVIQKSGFISQELLAEPMMFEYFAPIVKKDFSLQESYLCEEIKPISTPVVAMFGADDESLQNREYINNWSKYTEKEFSVEEFPGSHFYIEKELEQVAGVIEKYLKA